MRQLFYDGSRSLPPFFGWRQARGWIAGRALRGQRAGPGVRVADCDRAGLQQDQGVLPAAGRRKGPWLAKWGREMYALSDFLIMVFVMVSEAVT